MADSAASAIRLTLLGGFSLSDGRQATHLGPNVQRVIAFLALSGRSLRRSYVGGTLWPEMTEERAAANLRSVLWRLREVRDDVVRATSSEIQLSERVAVDLHEALGNVRRFLQSLGAGLDPAVTVSGLLEDLLPGWYDDWVVLERERFRELRVHALEGLCERFTALGRFAEAVEAGLAAVAGEPLEESAHRALIRAHLAEGNPGKAVGQYERYRRLLREELGVEPTDAIKLLVSSATAVTVG